MPLSMGGGLAGAGLEEQQEATQQLGEAAQVETNRNLENERIKSANRSSNVSMGTGAGALAGMYAGTQIGGTSGGPWGAAIGAIAGGLIGGLSR